MADLDLGSMESWLKRDRRNIFSEDLTICYESNHLIARYFPEARSSGHLPQPDRKALPDDWRPVRCLPRVLVGVAHWHVARAVLL